MEKSIFPPRTQLLTDSIEGNLQGRVEGTQTACASTRTEGFAVKEVTAHVIPKIPSKDDHYTMVLGLAGFCKKSVGHHSFLIQPGSLSIIRPNEVNAYDNYSSDLKLHLLLFRKEFVQQCFTRPEILEELVHLNPDYPPSYQLEAEAVVSVERKFSDIHREYSKQGPFYLNMIRLTIIQLLYDYNRACEMCLLGFNKKMNRQYQLTYQFKQLVEAEFLRKRTVQEYADQVGVTAKHLSESVKQETGISALDIIHKRVLLEAEYLLKHSNKSIKEIVWHLGFDSSSHFSRFFKAKKGLTPAEYRAIP